MTKLKMNLKWVKLLILRSLINKVVYLDIGGTGRIVKLFEEKGIPAEGLEISSSMISKAEENFPNCSF